MIGFSGIIMIALTLGLTPALFSQVEFIEVVTPADMDEAREKAAKGDLMLFVDVYATWCGPCKVMDREVYSDRTVAEVMNASFVSVRMDGETDFGRKYAAEQGLTGYPSMFVFDPSGDPVGRLIGFRPAGEMVTALRGMIVNHKALKTFRSQYTEGELTAEAFREYIELVREMGNEQEAEKLAGQYIKERIDTDLSDNDIRVVAFYMNLDDPWWKAFTSDPDRIRQVLGDEFVPAMEKVYHHSLVKAVESEDISLISRIANELSPLIEREAVRTWDLRSLPFIQYYYYTNQYEKLVSYVDQRFSSDRKGDHRWLFGAATQIIDMDQQYRDLSLMKKGEEWLRICIGYEENFDYYFYLGMALYFQQEPVKARGVFHKASELASTDEEKAMVIQVLGYIK
jgi:thiol-disulfide isomerase/thioredoxin